MDSQKNGFLYGLPDRFVAVEIETEAPPAFDAAQYSFFGDLSAADSGLEGALEDGLEAPPPEDGLGVQDYGLHGPEDDALPLEEEEDLSVAALFRNQLGLGPSKAPAKRVDPDEDAALDALLTDPLSVARSQLRDDDYDQHHRDLPSELYPTTGSQTAASTQPQSLFSAAPSSAPPPSTYSLFEPYNTPSPSDAASAAASAPAPALPPPPSTAGNSLLQMLKKPSQPPKAMTLEELEARMLGNVGASAAPPAAAAAGVEDGGIGAAAPGGPLGPIPGSGPMAMPPEAAAGLTLQAGPPYGQLPPPPPPGHGSHGAPLHGGVPSGPGMMPPPQPYGPHMPPPPPHMQPPHGMYGVPPPPMGGPAGPYPPPPPHMQPPHGGFTPHHPHPHPQHPHMMYNAPGMMPPLGHHLMGPMQHQMGPMGQPGSFGPGPMGPRPRLPGPMGGMGGHGPFPQDPGFQMRPGGPPAGQGMSMPPGTLHGPGPRPPPGYGPGPGPIQGGPHSLLPPGVPPQRLPGPLPGPSQQQQLAPQRPPPAMLGAGPMAGPRPAQARNGPDFGQQFARGGSGPAQQTAVTLAAAAAAAGRAGGVLRGPGGRLSGKFMTPENIEYVVRSLLHNVASGVPYVEDYYYQAFVHKHVSAPSRQQLSPGAFPMAALFVPQSLRTPTADQMRVMRLDPSAHVKFVEGLEGLGKIVLSNIRTPKVLMDLSDRGAAGSSNSAGAGEGSGGAKAPDAAAARSARPLEQEPLLAARIMIEDCMNLLLDLDDIDRLATHLAAVAHAQQRAAAVAAALPLPGPAAAGAAAAAATAAAASAAGVPAIGPYGPDSETPPAPAELRQRRDLLLAGINGAFRLPGAPQGASAPGAPEVIDEDEEDGEGSRGGAAGQGSVGDGVLLRILAISKGRNMVSRALLATAPPTCFDTLVLKPAAAKAAAPAAAQQQQSSNKKMDVTVAGDKAASTTGGSGEAGAAAAAEDAASSTEPGAKTSAAAPAEAGQPSSASSSGSEDGPSPYVLLWGTLRHAWTLFGSSLQQGLDAAAERPMLEATARLAAALRDALLRLPTANDVVDAAVAFNVGCQQHITSQCQANPGAAGSMELTLLPLAQTRAVETAAVGSVTAAPPVWLGEALAALVMRAGQLGLATAAAAGDEAGAAAPEEGSSDRGKAQTPSEAGQAASEGAGAKAAADAVDAAWSREYGRLHDRLARHLTALGGIHSMAVASANAEAQAVVRAMCCRQLVNAMLPHASTDQARQLREALAAFAA